jgi:hypothetical protein
MPPKDSNSRLAYAFAFAIAISGLNSVGSFSAVPFAPLLFVMIGWNCRDARTAVPGHTPLRKRAPPERQALPAVMSARGNATPLRELPTQGV